MIDWFIQRTNKHIKLVNEYVNKTVESYPEFNNLKDIVKSHDKSKFEEPINIPYILITWKYKCQRDNVDFELSDALEKQLINATIYHILDEKHHCEYWDKNFTVDKFNSNNRDGLPEKMVDATKMPLIYIAEMVCDWCAVSKERDSHPKNWADMNINKRWKFTEQQKELIYNLINEIYETR